MDRHAKVKTGPSGLGIGIFSKDENENENEAITRKSCLNQYVISAREEAFHFSSLSKD